MHIVTRILHVVTGRNVVILVFTIPGASMIRVTMMIITRLIAKSGPRV